MITCLEKLTIEMVFTLLSENEIHHYECNLYKVHTKLQVLIFSKVKGATDRFTVAELESLINFISIKYNMDHNQVIWINNYSSDEKEFNYDVYSLVNVQWEQERAKVTSSIMITENWYLSWIEPRFITINPHLMN